MRFSVCAFVFVATLACLCLSSAAQARDPILVSPPGDPFGTPIPIQSVSGTTAEPEEPAKEDKETPVAPAPAPAEKLPPGTVRVHLHDGSMITGVLSNESIQVATQFGSLTVPVDKIVSFTPGLDSQTDRMELLKTLINQLGDKSYSARDAAEKKLILMGAKIRDELERHRKDENAERKNRIQKILATIADMEDEEEAIEGDAQDRQPWRRLDTVVTEPFTLAGTIEQKQFELASKYGKLNIALADIRRVERPRSGREAYRRNVSVAGTNIAPNRFKNSHIAVQPGDRVSIRADGVLRMTPWGSSAVSTPDGAPNYGWYINGKIASGALVMRLGNNGQPEKVGSKHTFTAKKAGTLQFGIGMNSSYVNHSFPGNYNLKISVQPAGS